MPAPPAPIASPFCSETTELHTEAKSEPGSSFNDGSPYFTVGQQFENPTGICPHTYPQVCTGPGVPFVAA